MTNFAERIAQRVQQRDDERLTAAEIQDFSDNEQVELFEGSAFFGKEQIRHAPTCLELRFSNGSSKAIPYSFIMEINFNPSEGIEIITTQKKISVEGRNLKILYSFLLSFQVRYIQENIGHDLTEENKLFVKKLSLVDN
jgi:hypothetical protein